MATNEAYRWDTTCRMQLHKGACQDGAGCSNKHLTTEEFMAHPMCKKASPCPFGDSCMFRHPCDRKLAPAANKTKGLTANMLMLPPGEHFVKVLVNENSNISSAEKQQLTGGDQGAAEQEDA